MAGAIGIRSIDAKITILLSIIMTKTIGLWLMLF